MVLGIVSNTFVSYCNMLASQTSVCVFWKKFDVSSQGDKPYDYKFLYAIWCSDLIS